MRHSLTALAVIATLTSAPDLRADVRAEIRKLVPEASAMKQADFEKLARSAAPNLEDIEEKSLTLMLLQVKITPDASAAQRKELRYQQPPKPDELAAEIYRIASRDGKRVVLKGPVTFLSANRITNVTAEVEGDQATGTVSFKAPNLSVCVLQGGVNQGPFDPLIGSGSTSSASRSILGGIRKTCPPRVQKYSRDIDFSRACPSAQSA